MRPVVLKDRHINPSLSRGMGFLIVSTTHINFFIAITRRFILRIAGRLQSDLCVWSCKQWRRSWYSMRVSIRPTCVILLCLLLAGCKSVYSFLNLNDDTLESSGIGVCRSDIMPKVAYINTRPIKYNGKRVEDGTVCVQFRQYADDMVQAKSSDGCDSKWKTWRLGMKCKDFLKRVPALEATYSIYETIEE